MELPENKKIILFDGICNLCDATVQFIIKRDKNDVFRFVAQQSEAGAEILNFIGVDNNKTDSIILYEPGIAYYTKAEAAIKIAGQLGYPYTMLNIFLHIPKSLSNIIYHYVAKNRYKWYGKKEACMLPTPETKAKFL